MTFPTTQYQGIMFLFFAPTYVVNQGSLPDMTVARLFGIFLLIHMSFCFGQIEPSDYGVGNDDHNAPAPGRFGKYFVYVNCTTCEVKSELQVQAKSSNEREEHKPEKKTKNGIEGEEHEPEEKTQNTNGGEEHELEEKTKNANEGEEHESEKKNKNSNEGEEHKPEKITKNGNEGEEHEPQEKTKTTRKRTHYPSSPGGGRTRIGRKTTPYRVTKKEQEGGRGSQGYTVFSGVVGRGKQRKTTPYGEEGEGEKVEEEREVRARLERMKVNETTARQIYHLPGDTPYPPWFTVMAYILMKKAGTRSTGTEVTGTGGTGTEVTSTGEMSTEVTGIGLTGIEVTGIGLTGIEVIATGQTGTDVKGTEETG